MIIYMAANLFDGIFSVTVNGVLLENAKNVYPMVYFVNDGTDLWEWHEKCDLYILAKYFWNIDAV